MGQNLMAHPETGQPAIKVINYTLDGERVDWEVREIKTLQAAVDQAYDETARARTELEDIKSKAEQMVKDAQAKFDEVESRLEDCKSDLERGQAISADPGAYQGAETTSRPDPPEDVGTAGTGFGFH